MPRFRTHPTHATLLSDIITIGYGLPNSTRRSQLEDTSISVPSDRSFMGADIDGLIRIPVQLSSTDVLQLDTGRERIRDERLLDPLGISVGVVVNAPWSLLLKILQKVASDQAEVRCITPYWTQQPWWPLLLSLATDHPRLIPEFPDLLQVPQDQDSQGRPARLPPSTRLIAWKLIGGPSLATDFRRALWHTSQQRGAAATKVQNWRLYRYVPSRRSSRCQYY
jgi:hypothetical protein